MKAISYPEQYFEIDDGLMYLEKDLQNICILTQDQYPMEISRIIHAFEETYIIQPYEWLERFLTKKELCSLLRGESVTKYPGTKFQETLYLVDGRKNKVKLF